MFLNTSFHQIIGITFQIISIFRLDPVNKYPNNI